MSCANCTCSWSNVPDRLAEVRRLFALSAGYIDQTPGRGGITGQQHALRTAALARNIHPDAAFVGLVHDLARPLNDVHHGEIMAEIVRDRVSVVAYEVLRTHGAFQSSIVHGLAWPEAPEEWSGFARRLAGCELGSFAKNYHGPELTLEQADELLRDYLA